MAIKKSKRVQLIWTMNTCPYCKCESQYKPNDWSLTKKDTCEYTNNPCNTLMDCILYLSSSLHDLKNDVENLKNSLRGI